MDLNSLFGGAVADCVAGALLHFLWQGGLVAVALAAVLGLLRDRAPAVRYNLACVALSLMVVLPVATAVYHYDGGTGTSAGTLPATLPAGTEVGAGEAVTAADLITLPARYVAARWDPSGLVPWIVPLWLAGVLFLALRNLHALQRVRRLRTLRVTPVAQSIQATGDRLARRIGLDRAVRMLESALVEVPTVIGWLSPIILLPAASVAGLDRRQLESIILHELAHIRRRDYLINLLQVLAENLLFYHPAVWWVSRRIRVERENCCDDVAVRLCGDVSVYAGALVRLEQLRPSEPKLALGADGGSLLHRIRRLAGGRSMSGVHTPQPRLAGVLVAALLLVGGTVLSVGAEMWSGTTEPAEGVVDAAMATWDEDEDDERSARSARASARARSSSGTRSWTIEETSGDWTLRERDGETRLKLDIDTEHGHSNMTLRGVDARDFDEGEDGVWTIRREAGTFRLEGDVRDVDDGLRGNGFFDFEVDEDYLRELGDLGVDGLNDHEVFILAACDITTDYVEELNEVTDGRVDGEELIAVAIHGVDSTFIRDLDRLGYGGLDLERMVAMRIHGVTPQYIDELGAEGYERMSVDDMLGWRIHGVTPAFIAELEELGYDDLEEEKLVAMRIHGVTPDFIDEMRESGREDMSVQDLLSWRIHGVSPEFIAEVERVGLRNLDDDELVSMRIHGVTPDFIREMGQVGYADAELEDLLSWKIHGVSPGFVEDMEELGYDDLDIEQLVAFRIHGISTEFVRAMDELGYGGLSPKRLLEFRIHGVTPKYIRRLRDKGIEDLSAKDLVRLRISGVEL